MRDNGEVVRFVRARLGEDEAAARARQSLGVAAGVRQGAGAPGWVTAPAGDPARVLRGVEAKRRLVIRWEATGAMLEDEVDPMRWQELSVARFVLGGALRELAGEWADHPEYDAAWAV